MLKLTNKILLKLCTLSKVGRSKPGVVLTGCNCPGQYSRSGHYWSIEKQSSQLNFWWLFEEWRCRFGFHFG